MFTSMDACFFIDVPLPFDRPADFGFTRAAFSLALDERFGRAASLEGLDFRFVLVATVGDHRARMKVVASAVGSRCLDRYRITGITAPPAPPIAGLYGRQPVMRGVQEVRAERYALGIPFHDYAGS
jgi:hypothetical protein